mmetsp:Transcript_50260/g.83277  ORF Transcript_50260/g.83277 Transcript_50260/m.83277 type:complete len:83 (-) Transcript_50260:34-282(-)
MVGSATTVRTTLAASMCGDTRAKVVTSMCGDTRAKALPITQYHNMSTRHFQLGFTDKKRSLKAGEWNKKEIESQRKNEDRHR